MESKNTSIEIYPNQENKPIQYFIECPLILQTFIINCFGCEYGVKHENENTISYTNKECIYEINRLIKKCSKIIDEYHKNEDISYICYKCNSYGNDEFSFVIKENNLPSYCYYHFTREIMSIHGYNENHAKIAEKIGYNYLKKLHT